MSTIGFCRVRKTCVPRGKPTGVGKRTKKTQPIYGIWISSHWWKASALNEPTLLSSLGQPCSHHWAYPAPWNVKAVTATPTLLSNNLQLIIIRLTEPGSDRIKAIPKV